MYDLSIFSNIPPSLSETLPITESLLRIRPLFNVGIHDIPELSQSSSKESDNAGSHVGCIACTTDDILATKTSLYDLLVEMPHSSPGKPSASPWPSLRTADGITIKATQRDLRRYLALRRGMRRMQTQADRASIYHDDDRESGDDNDNRNEDEDTHPLMHSVSSLTKAFKFDGSGDIDEDIDNEAAIIEPSSWASIAYTSLFWWASAGEKDTLIEEEDAQDSSLLDDLYLAASASSASTKSGRKPPSTRGGGGNATTSTTDPEQGDAQTADMKTQQAEAMVLIAYFHRLSTLILTTLSDLVGNGNSQQSYRDDEDDTEDDDERSPLRSRSRYTDDDDDDDDNLASDTTADTHAENNAISTAVDDDIDEETPINTIESDDMRRMGLDVWSANDRAFVQGLARLYFGRHVVVRGGAGVEVCGLRIC